MIPRYIQKWQILIFFFFFLCTQNILFASLFCIGDIMKDKTVKATVLEGRVGSIQRMRYIVKYIFIFL